MGTANAPSLYLSHMYQVRYSPSPSTFLSSLSPFWISYLHSSLCLSPYSNIISCSSTESLSTITKARGNTHKPVVSDYLKYMHIVVYGNTLAELDESVIHAKLAAAGGVCSLSCTFPFLYLSSLLSLSAMYICLLLSRLIAPLSLFFFVSPFLLESNVIAGKLWYWR